MDKLNLILDVLAAQLAMLLVLAGTVERISEFVKMGIRCYTKKDIPPYAKQILVLAVSIVFAIVTETQFEVGLQIPAIANQIIAGLIISFGSDTLHAILSFIRSLKTNNEAKAASVDSYTQSVIEQAKLDEVAKG